MVTGEEQLHELQTQGGDLRFGRQTGFVAGVHAAFVAVGFDQFLGPLGGRVVHRTGA